MVKNILMVGVGGQGIILASNIACSVFLASGYDVKKSEIHGMAQRGGSVVSHIRFGEKIFSPVIPQASADVIVSFENMEFLRYMEFVKPSTALILNEKKILPPSVSMGELSYPDKEVEDGKKTFSTVLTLDAERIALDAGNLKVAGMAMLGDLCKVLGMNHNVWLDVISKSVPPKTVDVNLKAFESCF